MTKILIVYCHPYAKSFNHAILEAVKHNFDHHQVSYTLDCIIKVTTQKM